MPPAGQCEKSACFWFHTASDQKQAESSTMLISRFHLLAETRYQRAETSEVFIVPPAGHLLYYSAATVIINASRVNLPHDKVIGYQTRTRLKDPFPISRHIWSFTCQLPSGCSGHWVVPRAARNLQRLIPRSRQPGTKQLATLLELYDLYDLCLGMLVSCGWLLNLKTKKRNSVFVLFLTCYTVKSTKSNPNFDENTNYQ